MSGRRNNYAFIDSQNLNLGVKDLGWDLDFARFRRYLADKYGVTTAYLFIGYKPGNEGLYARLQKYGYVCIFKPTMTLLDGTVKGNVDAELVLHTMIELGNYERAVIVTGDGDFHCLAAYLISQGKLERVLLPNIKKSSKLLRSLTSPRRNVLGYVEHLRCKLEKRK
jgi:uncharacterized LabA/DUF88 family protein